MQDETIRQKGSTGTPLAQVLASRGIVPGIKVDTGAKPLALAPGETITEGLDGLRERLAEYRGMGARFAKWRAVIHIADRLPSRACLSANAHALARYAALCQEASLLPIVEPEVLMDGSHSIERCEEVTTMVLHAVFQALSEQRVSLESMLLKPNMVVPGTASSRPASVQDVATQDSALEAWHGRDENTKSAQEALSQQARCNGAPSLGRYTDDMEVSPASPAPRHEVHDD
jgi:fructose-bisphosphate aldolase class I